MELSNKKKNYVLKPVSFNNVRIQDNFWGPRILTLRNVTLKSCMKKCEETGRISNFLKASGQLKGDFEGIYFNDSDVYKLLEAIAYSLQDHPDEEFERYADEIIDKIVSAQEDNGYLDTYFILSKSEERWTDMERHEDYCLGHMIEAAIAYKHVTGKEKFLKAAIKMADHFDSVVGPDKKHWVPGHQEIELALVKLFHETGNDSYLKLANWLLEERGHGHGVGANLWGIEKWGPKYAQDDIPVREMTEIKGHAVRAMYMYAGMADVAAISRDTGYLITLEKLWESVVFRNMYITGGIGSSKENEGFTQDYDLPNDTAYCETCASVGMVYWNHRMNLLHCDSKYADIMELSMYNGALAGMSYSGDEFFYVNPLETNGDHHRQGWFDVSCCPTQISRFIPSIGNYLYAVSETGIYINLYIASSSYIKVNENQVSVVQETEYPLEGTIKIKVTPEIIEEFEINLRLPSWSKSVKVSINGNKLSNLYVEKGYIKILREWAAGDEICLELDMSIQKVISHPRVKMNAGKLAIKCGPLVYCVEECDNRENYEKIGIDNNTELKSEFKPEILGGVQIIKALNFEGDLKFIAIPYFAWDNREPGRMKVWISDMD